MEQVRKKTLADLDEQYKRVLRTAFPKLRFRGVRWNWDKVYDGSPYQNPIFVKINDAFISTAKKMGHPFYNQ